MSTKHPIGHRDPCDQHGTFIPPRGNQNAGRTVYRRITTRTLRKLLRGGSLTRAEMRRVADAFDARLARRAKVPG